MLVYQQIKKGLNLFKISTINRSEKWTYEFAKNKNDMNVCDSEKLLSNIEDRFEQRYGLRIP